MKAEEFLANFDLPKKDVEEDIKSGRFPPCIPYQIIYFSPEERRVKPAMMKVDVHGADKPISFVCTVKEELCECACIQCVFVCNVHVWTGGCLYCICTIYCSCNSTATCTLQFT